MEDRTVYISNTLHCEMEHFVVNKNASLKDDTCIISSLEEDFSFNRTNDSCEVISKPQPSTCCADANNSRNTKIDNEKLENLNVTVQENEQTDDNINTRSNEIKIKPDLCEDNRTTLLDISYVNKEEIQKVKDGIERGIEQTYVKENIKYNNNESASLAELNAITTQNFNLINDEFEQRNDCSELVDLSYSDCLHSSDVNAKMVMLNDGEIHKSNGLGSNQFCDNENNIKTKELLLNTSHVLFSNENDTSKLSDNLNTQDNVTSISATGVELDSSYETIKKMDIQDKSDSDSGLDLVEDVLNTPTGSLSPSITSPVSLCNTVTNATITTSTASPTTTNTANITISTTSTNITNSVTDIGDLSVTDIINDFPLENISNTYNSNELVLDKENCNNLVLYNPNVAVSNCSYSAYTLQKSNLKRLYPISDNVAEDRVQVKKAKRGIAFDKVSVFYFPRTQGFTCIPSQGGSTLGMSWNHSHCRTFSLVEHAAEQKKNHKQLFSQQYPNMWNEMSAVSSEDSDSEEQISDSETDYENYNFLQPIPTSDRRAMLRSAGVRKIDSSEKDECRQIRLSREYCGCSCQTYCDPDTCACAQAGIKCQVDRLNFPCSCTRDGCINPNGRVEFNPVRVRTHYIHTLMRLEIEKKQAQEHALMQREGIDVSLTPSVELQSCIRTNNFFNFHYPSSLQPYYQQQQEEQQEQYNTVVTSSCFNFHYNQFFSSSATSYQQSNPINLLPPAIEYNPPTSLYDSSMHVLQQFSSIGNVFNNINETSEDISQTDSNDTEGKIESFDDLLEDSNNQSINDAESNDSDLKVENAEEDKQSYGGGSRQDEESEEYMENLGEIIKKTIVESVTV